MNKIQLSKFVLKHSTESAMLLTVTFLVWGVMKGSTVLVAAYGLMAFTVALMTVKYVNAQYMKHHLRKCGFSREEIPSTWALLFNEALQSDVSRIMSFPIQVARHYRIMLLWSKLDEVRFVNSRMVTPTVARALGHLDDDMSKEFKSEYMYYIYVTLYRHEFPLTCLQEIFISEFMRKHAAQLATMLMKRPTETL